MEVEIHLSWSKEASPADDSHANHAKLVVQ